MHESLSEKFADERFWTGKSRVFIISKSHVSLLTRKIHRFFHGHDEIVFFQDWKTTESQLFDRCLPSNYRSKKPDERIPGNERIWPKTSRDCLRGCEGGKPAHVFFTPGTGDLIAPFPAPIRIPISVVSLSDRLPWIPFFPMALKT